MSAGFDVHCGIKNTMKLWDVDHVDGVIGNPDMGLKYHNDFTISVSVDGKCL